MKTLTASLLICTLLAAPGFAAIYTDATNDIFTAIPIMDIVSAEVTNDYSEISFTVELVGDIEATDWGKYMVGIDSGAGGDAAGNGWARPISMSDGGMNVWLGGWVDSGGAVEAYNYVGASWVKTNNQAVAINGTTVTYTVSLSEIGLSAGDTIDFDIYSSGGGGGDGAVDALANPSQTIGDWGESYDSTNNVYTYKLIPEPTALALAGLAVLGLLARRR